jgi:hypothetical protein
MDLMAPPSADLSEPAGVSVTAADVGMLDRMNALGMEVIEALAPVVKREAAEGEIGRSGGEMRAFMLTVQRGLALKGRFARDARQAVSGEGRGWRRAPNHPRKRRLRELVAQQITDAKAGPLKTAQLLRALDTRLDCLDLGAELGDRPLGIIALDITHGLGVPLGKCRHTDEEIAEAQEKLKIRAPFEDDIAQQAAARAAVRPP